MDCFSICSTNILNQTHTEAQTSIEMECRFRHIFDMERENDNPAIIAVLKLTLYDF